MADSPPDSQHSDHRTMAKDRVPLHEKLGLGFGRAVADGTHGTLHVLIGPVYNMTLGLNPVLIGTIVFIQRLWSAMLDPVFGQFSDNFRSRWGRRRPLLLAGVFPVALFFAALWWLPHGASDHYLFWHLLLVSLVFYVGLSLFSMPLNGLIVEATDDYHERTRLAAVTLAFGFAAQVGSQWVFPLAQRSFFHDSVNGMRWVGAGCAVIFLVAGLLPFLLCRERLYAKVSVKQAKIPFMASLRAVRGNRSFMALLLARGVYSFGYNSVAMFSSYMNTYYVFGGDIKAASVVSAVVGTCFHISSIVVSLLLYPWIERHIGKKRTLWFAVCTMIGGGVVKYFLYQPGHAWLPIGVIVVNAITTAGVALMSIAMLGDIADYDEYTTGLRREGVFSALLSWFEKAGNALGSFLTWFILVWIGFDAKLGPQSAHTLHWMKACYILLPVTGSTLALLFLRRYELTQEQVYTIKDELARRRSATSGGNPG